MSTLKVTNIQATGETASRAVSGVAAAWGAKNSAGTSILDSFNISSLSDNGTGAAQWNYSNNFANVNYCFSSGVRAAGARYIAADTSKILVSSLEVSTYNSSVSNADIEFGTEMNGDLA
jgi:hypothetical protein